MKKLQFRWLLTCSLVVTILMQSCSGEVNRDKQVAALLGQVKSPMLVANMLPSNLLDKSGALDGALPFTQEMLLNFFIDEKTTGVDYDTKVQIIVSHNGGITPVLTGVFKLKDESVFIDLLETEVNAEVKEKDGFKYVIQKSDSYVIVWNKEFAIASNIPIDLNSLFSGGDNGMKAVNANIALINAAQDGEPDQAYTEFLKSEADISMRYTGKSTYQYLNSMSMGKSDELVANKELIEGMNGDLFLNFNQGSVDLQVLSDFSDKVKEELNFFNKKGISDNLLQYGNSENPMLMIGYNIDFKKWLDYMESSMNEDEIYDIEKSIEKLGLDKNTAAEALNGDVLVVVDHFEIKTEVIDYGYGEPYEITEPLPIYGAMATVKSTDFLNELTAQIPQVAEGVYQSKEAYLVLKEDVLFASNDSLWALNVSQGNTVNIENKDNVLSEKPVALFVDFMSISKLPDLKEVRAIVDILVDLKVQLDMDELNLSLRFKDESQNALRILTERLSALDSEMVEKDDAYKQLEAELEAAAAGKK